MPQLNIRSGNGFADVEITHEEASEEFAHVFSKLVDLHRSYSALQQKHPPTLDSLDRANTIGRRLAKSPGWDEVRYKEIRPLFLRPSDPRWIWLSRLVDQGRVADAAHFYAGLVGDLQALIGSNSPIVSLIAEYQADRQKSGQPQQIVEQAIAELQSRVHLARTSLDAEVTGVAERSRTTFESMDEAKGEWENRASEWLEEKQKEYQALVDTYANLIPNNEASKYWEAMQAEYELSRRRWGIASLVYFAGAIAALVGLAIPTLGHVLKHPDELHLWLIGWTIITVGLLFWPLRIILRTYLSAHHLMLDASHRKLLINTYLAMLKFGHAIPDDQRTYFLESIFRPASDGIVRDDAAPLSTLEQILRTVKPGS